MSEKFSLQAISEISEPEKIRVVIFVNNELVHAPLTALVAHLVAEIEDLKARVTALETP